MTPRLPTTTPAGARAPPRPPQVAIKLHHLSSLPFPLSLPHLRARAELSSPILRPSQLAPRVRGSRGCVHGSQPCTSRPRTSPASCSRAPLGLIQPPTPELPSASTSHSTSDLLGLGPTPLDRLKSLLSSPRLIPFGLVRPPAPKLPSASAPLGLDFPLGLGPARPQTRSPRPPQVAPELPSASYGLQLPSFPRPPQVTSELPSACSPRPRTVSSSRAPLDLPRSASAPDNFSCQHEPTPTCSVHMHESGAILLLFHAATSQQHIPSFPLSLSTALEEPHRLRPASPLGLGLPPRPWAGT